MKILFTFFIVVILFSSCDIVRFTEIDNNTQNEVQFRLKYSQLDTSIFIVKPKENITIFDGFGNYSNRSIHSWCANIDFLELSTKNTHLLLKDKNDIFNYLKKHRKGLFKNKIKIVVNE